MVFSYENPDAGTRAVSFPPNMVVSPVAEQIQIIANNLKSQPPNCGALTNFTPNNGNPILPVPALELEIPNVVPPPTTGNLFYL